MTISVTHNFVSAKPQGTDATKVRTNDWNAGHTIAMSSGYFIGRKTAGDGAAEELDLAYLYEQVSIAMSDLTTALTTGTGKAFWRPMYSGYIMGFRASLMTAQASGATLLQLDVRKGGTSIFGTKPTFDNTEKTTLTAATAYSLTSTPLAFSDDDEFLFDISQIGDSGAKGLIAHLLLRRY